MILLDLGLTKRLFANWRTVPAVLYILSIALIFGALYLGIEHHPKRSDAVLTVGLLVSLAAFVVLLAKKRLGGSRAACLFVCYPPFAMVWL